MQASGYNHGLTLLPSLDSAVVLVCDQPKESSLMAKSFFQAGFARRIHLSCRVLVSRWIDYKGGDENEKGNFDRGTSFDSSGFVHR